MVENGILTNKTSFEFERVCLNENLTFSKFSDFQHDKPKICVI